MTVLVIFAACAGLNPRVLPTQDIYADDGEVRTSPEDVQFAVLGDVRPPVAGEARVAVPGGIEAVVADVSAEIQAERVDYVVLMGNLVRSSTTAEWKSFSAKFGPVLSGSELPEMGVIRVRSVPVAGADDRNGDDRLFGWGAAFPGAGASIGTNRVASWYAFDVEVRDHRWRMVVLDSDRARLGSRWDEQMAWIPRALDGKGYNSALVFMHHPLITLAKGGVSNEASAPSELIEAVEDATKLGAVKAVFAGHTGANEVFLPSGKFGILHVNAGTAGASAATLARWGHAEAAGHKDVKLETLYDLALMREFDRVAEARKFSQGTIDHAHATGSYEGFEAEYEAAAFPIVGYFNVALAGAGLDVTFRYLDDGVLRDVWTASWEGKAGWKIGQ